MDVAKTGAPCSRFYLRPGALLGRSPPSGAILRPRRCRIVAGVLVLTGTIFYWRFEDWTIVEALYFCIVTLTTVGYGDLAPTTDGTQIFTIIYILTGLGMLVALLSFGRASNTSSQKAERGGARERLRARRERRQAG